MTENGGEDSNPSPTPADRAWDGMKAALEVLEQSDANSPLEQAEIEDRAVSEVVESVAGALNEGLNDPVGKYAGPVADECAYTTKTSLKQQIKERVESLRGQNRTPTDEFLEDRLESVTIVKTTDHRQGAEYIWDFGTFKVETRSGKDRRGHYAWDNFRNYIHESGGVDLSKPQQERRGGEEWREFVNGLIDECGNTLRTRGERTIAYEKLRNRIRSLPGHGTAETALDKSGIWIVREMVDIPDWWGVFTDQSPADDRDLVAETVQEVRVHEDLITSVLDDRDVTRQALYHELNARNLTVPGRSGASMSKWVNGTDRRFWTLLPDVGTPRTYIPDANAAATSQAPALSFGLSATDEQDDEQPTDADEPAEAGESDARDSSDGFDGVGDTA